jgi:alkylation response protein AidB-like acyl-CoA dehydrogenase
VHFAFDEDQLEFRAQLRAFADKECSPGELRKAWESPYGWSVGRWEALATMGVVGMTAPEEHGGLGLSELDLVLVLEEIGRSGIPEPVLETTALAVPMLVDAEGDEVQTVRDRWLPQIATGAAVATFGRLRSPGMSAPGADLFLLEADGEVLALPKDAVELLELASVDGSRRLAVPRWAPGAGTVIASGDSAGMLVERTLDRAATGSAAILVGVADHLVTMAADHARDRHQFGKAIGSFQAVKHHMANALIALEFARPLVYRAAWSLSSGSRDASLHASMAKARASDAATVAARVALQVHGAIGYTWEHDLHLWLKRAWALGAAWGDAGEHRARVLEHVATASAEEASAQASQRSDRSTKGASQG